MTNGGLLQLVAYGAQDVYLTANPQVTFFKQLYRRHSNFAMESIEQTFNGVANFGKRVTCTIARNGDLIHKVYLQVTLPSVSQAEVGQAAPWDLFNEPDTTSAYFGWTRNIGQAMVKQVEIEIGGQLIDRQYGEWLHLWNELTLPAGKIRDYNRMINGIGGVIIGGGTGTCESCEPNAGCGLATISEGLNIPYSDAAYAGLNNRKFFLLKSAAKTDVKSADDEKAIGFGDNDIATCPRTGYGFGNDGAIYYGDCLPETTLYIPLEFWFCRHAGLALPLIALQYHEVKINLDFQELRYLVNTAIVPPIVGAQLTPNTKLLSDLNSKGLVAASLWVDYIYLDTEERRRFAQVAHEYLIEQLQFTGEESLTSTSNKIRLQFNHPVKELVWVSQFPAFYDCKGINNNPFCYTDERCQNPTAVAKLQLNGQDRFQEREGSYFNFVQPYQHHTNSPQLGINVYSFALKPEDLQPSGSCNFSRIDNATLNLTLTPGSIVPDEEGTDSRNFRIYATNYNVLRIMSGMGGLAYSN